MRGSCPHCGGLVTFDDLDLLVVENGSMSKHCPECGELIDSIRDLEGEPEA